MKGGDRIIATLIQDKQPAHQPSSPPPNYPNSNTKLEVLRCC
jgi:hypothetical protein